VEEAFRVATEALEPYECVLDRRSSEDAVRDVPDGSLDFVYIDGNHSYLHCVQDLEWWSRKVRSGGIVAGHDFRHFPVEDNVHVIEAVTGFTAAHAITPWFLMGRYKVARSRLNKRGGERTERCRTYLWVNP
jgi:predicted O-methyltransferase YrrM